MNILENYSKVSIENLLDSNNKFQTAMIIFKEENTGWLFPLGIEDSFFDYLQSILKDKIHEENFLCDIVYSLEKPKGLYIEFKNNKLSCFYINKNDKKISLNLMDLLSIAIRYPITDIYLENQLIHPEFLDDFFINADMIQNKKVDLYRLDKQHLESQKH